MPNLSTMQIRHLYISMCRKEKRFTGEEIPETVVDDREEVIESIIRREEYRSLYCAIDLLPDAQKEVVIPVRFYRQPQIRRKQNHPDTFWCKTALHNARLK